METLFLLKIIKQQDEYTPIILFLFAFLLLSQIRGGRVFYE